MIVAIENIFLWIGGILEMLSMMYIPLKESTSISILNLGIVLSLTLIIVLFVKRIFETRSQHGRE